MRFPSITAKGFALVCAGLLALMTSGAVIRFDHNEVLTQRSIRGLVENADSTIGNAREATGKVNGYLTVDVLRDLQNDLSASAGAAQITENSYADVARSTSNAINRHVAPGVDRVVASVEQRMLTLDGFIAQSNTSINGDGGLLPRATTAFGALNTNLVSLNDVEQAAKIAIEKLGMPIEPVTRLLAGGNIPLIFSRLADGSLEFKEFTAAMKVDAQHMRQAVNNFAELLDLYSQYTRTANKFHKWVLLAQILNLLGGLPRP
jgi:hypothetical protein